MANTRLVASQAFVSKLILRMTPLRVSFHLRKVPPHIIRTLKTTRIRHFQTQALPYLSRKNNSKSLLFRMKQRIQAAMM